MRAAPEMPPSDLSESRRRPAAREITRRKRSGDETVSSGPTSLNLKYNPVFPAGQTAAKHKKARNPARRA